MSRGAALAAFVAVSAVAVAFEARVGAIHVTNRAAGLSDSEHRYDGADGVAGHRLSESIDDQAPVSWSAQQPDPSQPLGGFKLLDNVNLTRLYKAVPSVGTYNHAAMLGYDPVAKTILATWKCSPRDEDQPGQRILYSQTADGVHWTDPTAEMFPNVSTTSNPARLFAAPPLWINGHLYAAATPIQICLFPDQYPADLLLRRVYSNGTQQLGPVFWAASSVPTGFEEASNALGIEPIGKQDKTTQADVATLNDPDKLPCVSPSDGCLKCEACEGGCQPWSDVNLVNERTHYKIAGAAGVKQTSPPVGSDIILYRSREHRLYVAVREVGSANWSTPLETDIPDENSNFNAGVLPDGRRFLVSNANDGASIRDPLTIATSADGTDFDTVNAVFSCTQLGQPDQPNGCVARYDGKAKNPGPSYPQALVLDAPAPTSLQGMWIVATNNKEDVWIARVPYASLPTTS